eukprot:408561_1
METVYKDVELGKTISSLLNATKSAIISLIDSKVIDYDDAHILSMLMNIEEKTHANLNNSMSKLTNFKNDNEEKLESNDEHEIQITVLNELNEKQALLDEPFIANVFHLMKIKFVKLNQLNMIYMRRWYKIEHSIYQHTMELDTDEICMSVSQPSFMHAYLLKVVLGMQPSVLKTELFEELSEMLKKNTDNISINRRYNMIEKYVETGELNLFVIEDMITVYENVFDSKINSKRCSFSTKEDRHESIQRSLQKNEQWIKDCVKKIKETRFKDSFEEKKKFIWKAFSKIIYEAFTLKLDEIIYEFYSEIVDELNKYPGVCIAATNCMNNDSFVKNIQVNEINNQHLNEVLLQMMTADMLNEQVSRIKSGTLQFVTQLCENVILTQPAGNMHSLWVDDNVEYKDDDGISILQLLKMAQKSTTQLATIIKILCDDLTESATELKDTNFGLLLFLNLIQSKKEKFDKLENKKMFNELTDSINTSLKLYLNKLDAVWKTIDVSQPETWKTVHCEEHKEYSSECIECSNMLECIKHWTSVLKQKSDIIIFDHLCNNIQKCIDNSSSFPDLDALIHDVLMFYPYIGSKKQALNFKHDKMNDIWSNKPYSIQQCNIYQITQIVDFIISTHDLELTEEKPSILEYIKRNVIDGHSLYVLDMKNVAKYLSTNEWKASFIKSLPFLYSSIKTFDVKELFEDKEEKTHIIWSNKSRSIKDCSIHQIVVIVNHVIETDYSELLAQKPNILQYIKQHIANGKEFSAINKNDFANEIVKYVVQKRLERLEKLREHMLRFDLSIFAMIKVNEIIEMYLMLKNLVKDDKFKQEWFKLRRANTTNLDRITYFYSLVFAKSIKQSYQIKIPKLTEKNQKILDKFLQTGIPPVLKVANSNTNNSMIHIITKMFSVEFNAEIQATQMKALFVEFATQIIKEKLYTNQTANLKYKQNMRSAPLITIAKSKVIMKSMKQFKASWYQGKNQVYEIHPNQKIGYSHVFALVLYTHCSDLCTAFRETYRKISATESMHHQMRRHSEFANFGRLLYECFLFYGSTDAKINVLYHGMSIPLLFKTLYCTFDAPTSTTTAQSVGLQFGGQTGIIMKFESCDSTKYIKTMNMELFTCFPLEEEHLIFETRLHIQDIFMPQTTQWIGDKLMKRLSLY